MTYDVKAMANADGKVRARSRVMRGSNKPCSSATSATSPQKNATEASSAGSKQPTAKPAAPVQKPDTAALLRELNQLREAVGDKPLASPWKSSRKALHEALEKANARAMKTIDPLDIPAFLARKNPNAFINQAITPEIQARIDAAMSKAKTEVVGSSFAKIDAMRAEEKRAKLEKFKASHPKKERPKKAPPPADSFHLTDLCDELKIDARMMRRIARASVDFLKALEVQKYQYRCSDQARILQHIAGKVPGKELAS